jgi:4-hydroxybenzoate polyprenyltransferase
MLGMASGAVCGWFSGTSQRLVEGADFAITLVVGTVAAGLLNAASNSLNQIFDLEIDRINKPDRPLCRGDVSVAGTWVFTGLTAVASLALAAWVSVITGHWATIALFGAATLFTAAYSMPPLRMKARGWWANLTVAIPRGTLLKVAGWSLAASIVSAEAWYIGAIMGLFLIGATSTKDFADARGDAAHGVRSLPIIYGPRKAARLIAPFLALPFPLIPLGGWLGVLTPPAGHTFDLLVLGLTGTLWGAYIASLIVRDPDTLTRTENHPAWRHMYYLMLFLQLGFAVAYIPR